MLQAMDVLISYKEHHTLDEAKSDPVVYFGLVKSVPSAIAHRWR